LQTNRLVVVHVPELLPVEKLNLDIEDLKRRRLEAGLQGDINARGTRPAKDLKGSVVT